jgi:hypothetical protein
MERELIYIKPVFFMQNGYLTPALSMKNGEGVDLH